MVCLFFQGTKFIRDGVVLLKITLNSSRVRCLSASWKTLLGEAFFLRKTEKYQIELSLPSKDYLHACVIILLKLAG